MLQPLVWWLLAQTLGLAALPLAAAACRPLPGRGYPYAKPLGVLLAAWLLWLGVSLGALPNDAAGAALVVVVLALGAWGWRWWAERRGYAPPPLMPDRRGIVAFELAFTLAFVLALALRAADPAILGGEKPSELSILNATLTAAGFPPDDPWLAGFKLNYYSMGYVVLALLAHLAGTTAGVVFTLGLPLAFGLAATAAMGIGYDLVAWHDRHVAESAATELAVLPAASGAAEKASGGRPLVAGAASALFLLVAGNLEVLVEGVRALSGSAGQALGRWLGLTAYEPAFASDFWFPDAAHWWLRAPLVLRDRGIAGDVRPLSTEFPFYDLLIGDLHAPVLMLPFALLAVALALGVLARRRSGPPWLTATLLSLTLGALWAGNAWYLPPVGLLAAAAWALPAHPKPPDLTVRRATLRALARLAMSGLGLVIAAWALYLPFHASFEAPVQGVHWTFFEPTAFRQLLLAMGPLLLAAAMALAAGHRDSPVRLRRPLARLAAVTVAAPIVVLIVALAVTLSGVAAEQGTAYLPFLVGNLGALLGRRAAAGLTYLLITVGLAWAVTLAAAHGERGSHARAFAALLVSAALLALLAPELGFFDDGQGWRYNMVLKFHFMAWVLLAPVAGWGLVEAFARVRTPAGVRDPADRVLRVLAWTALAGGMLTLAYPVTASRAHLAAGDGWALDGASGYRVRHLDDARALAWLCTSIPAGTVIVEAVGQAFSDGGRISAATGLPAVLGWPGHQRTYRGPGIMDEVDRRRADVARVYTTADADELRVLLQRYDVGLVYLGRLERRAYPRSAEAAALAMLPAVYDDGVVSILRGPAAITGGARLRCRREP